MRASADDERRIFLANLQLTLADQATLEQEDEQVKEALLRFDDLVDALTDEVVAERLRGHVAWLHKDDAQAVKCFENAYLANNDLKAIIYLSFLSPETAKKIASPEDQLNINALVDDELERLDPFFALTVFRSQLSVESRLQRDGLLLSEEDFSRLGALASSFVLDDKADLAQLEARTPEEANAIRRAWLSRRWLMGESEVLSELLVLGQQDPYALFDLGQILIPFSQTFDPATHTDEIGEVEIRGLGKKPADFAMNLVIQAHEAGALRASVFLASQGYDPAWPDEISKMLQRLVPRETEPLTLTVRLGAPVASVFGNSHIEQGDDMEALKAWRDLIRSVLDRAMIRFGEVLVRESDGKGPWALLGDHLGRWGLGTGHKQDHLRANEVGSYDYPLVQRPFKAEDLIPELNPPTEISKRVKRLMDSLEQSDTKAEILGDTIQATWAHEQGPIAVSVKVVRKGDDYLVQTFVPLLIAKPDPNTSEIPPLDEFMHDERDAEVLQLLGLGEPGLKGMWFHGITHRHFGITRACLEALFQLGENGSRDVWLDQFFNLYRFVGRYMTFASPQTNKYFPSAWFSLVTVDSITPWLAERLGGLRFPHRAAVMFVGYEFSADQNAPRLKDDLTGSIQSVYSMSHLVAEMFESQPEVFQEIFDAVPVLKARAHLDEIRAELVGGPVSKNLTVGEIRSHMAENLSSGEDGLSQNDAGSYFLMMGEVEKALVCFEKAAKTGVANAVASLVWLYTVLDEHQEAVAAFERYLPHALQYISTLQGLQIPRDEIIGEVNEEITKTLRGMKEREDLTDEERAEVLTEAIAEFSLQIPNIQCNAAISYFALGDVASANELWAKAADDEHYEAPLFMAVAARRQGQAIGGLPPVDPDKLEDLVTDCETALKHAVGWAKEWYEDARALAVELRRP